MSNMRAVLLAKEITNAERIPNVLLLKCVPRPIRQRRAAPGLLDAYLTKLRATAADRFWQKVAKENRTNAESGPASDIEAAYCYTRWNDRQQMLAHQIAMSLTDGDWDGPRKCLSHLR